jgi:hypothetical protein
MRIIRNVTRFSSVLAAASSFGFVACDSDSGTPETDTSTQTDTSNGSDTSPEPDGSTGGDASDDTGPSGDTGGESDGQISNPCEDNPCQDAPAPRCSDDGKGVVTSADTGTCTAEGASFTCEYAESSVACDDGQVCVAGACVAAGDLCDYAFADRVSYVTEIMLGNQGAGSPPPDDCCFDFTGDGKNDNKLGSILKAASSLAGLNINSTIAEQIASGSLTLLLETRDVSDVSNDDNVGLYGFYGYDADQDADNNAAGTSPFVVNPQSFQGDTDIPLIGFPGAKITNGVFTAGPSLFQLSIPIVGANLELSISETQLEGEVAAGPNGLGLTMNGNAGKGAKLGGVIKRTDLFKAINTFVKTCTCVEIAEDGGDLIGPDGKCNAAVTTSCTADDGQACTQLPGFCGALIALVAPDVDLDGDGTKDAVSIGVWLKATSASITGIDQCVEPQ